MSVQDSIDKPDCFVICGSNDLYVPLYAASLISYYNPSLVICSGGVAHTADGLHTNWNEPESTVFTRLIKAACPRNAVVLEDKDALNTSDNIRNAIKITDGFRLFRDVCFIHKPFMTRRLRLTVEKQFPALSCRIIGSTISFDDYAKTVRDVDNLINIIVGDMDRIMKYPSLGYTERIDINSDVAVAFEYLVNNGYNRHTLTISIP